MNTHTRRKFLRDTSLTATGALLTSTTIAKNQNIVSSVIACGTKSNNTLTGTIKSIKSGLWSDSSVWGGKVPSPLDNVLISSLHEVILDIENATVSGINVDANAILKFDPSRSILLQTSKNIVIHGKLEIKPSLSSIKHIIRFINIDESKVQGATHDVLASDIGLWVMVSGKLDLQGSQKTSWTNLSDSVSAGQNVLKFKSTPINWQIGDEIVVCPTQSIDGLTQAQIEELFEKRKVLSISSGTLTLSSNLIKNHFNVTPTGSNKVWSPEVLNLTRNVIIEGTEKGRAHVFVRSTSPHIIKNVSFNLLGPRREQTGDNINEFILGRYALHFHHSMDGSRGTIVEGCIGQNIGSHVFVPHVSHGITFKSCVSFNTLETPFWWDMGDISHETIYDGCLVALNKFINGSGKVPARKSTAFVLGMGDDNSCINCVSVAGSLGYVDGNLHTTGAYEWEADNEGIWKFKNCLSHSDFVGLRGWQNTHRNHLIEDFDSYNNKLGIFHGAYSNCYTYRGGYHFNSPVEVKASSSNTDGVRFEHITIDGAGKLNYPLTIFDSPIPSPDDAHTNRFIHCTIKNYVVAPVLGTSTFEDNNEFRTIKFVDFINCDLGSKLPTYDSKAENGCWMRIQPLSGQAKKIEKSGTLNSSNGIVKVSDIAFFAPKIWGMGDGLNSEYFNNCNSFDNTKKVISRVDSNISFKAWHVDKSNPIGIHHKIKGDLFCIRWTGKLQAQFSEEYTFKINSAGGTRIYLNGSLILDAWSGEGFSVAEEWAEFSKPVKLVAGQLYDIKIEHYNVTGWRGCLISWMSPSMKKFHIIPQSQFFAGVVVNPPIEEKAIENQKPTAVAGDDIEITLPTNNITLNGSGSSDPEGKIAAYKWTKITGPSQFTMSNASAAITTVSNLIEGNYEFQLEIKDDKGEISVDTIKVTVHPIKIIQNNVPVANAGKDMVLSMPTNHTTLDGSASIDNDGKIISYKWTKKSGPDKFSFVNANAASTIVNSLIAGFYIFQLEVKDEKGATTTDTVTITINKAEEGKKAPVVNAGEDKTVVLPSNNVKISAKVTSQTGSSIHSYQWKKVSGPSKFKISNPQSPNTTLNQLERGTYVFQLLVKDNNGLIGKDEVTITVKLSDSLKKQTQTTELKQQEVLNISVSPNPSTSVFRVNINSNSDKPINLKLYDKWGIEVGNIKNIRKGTTITIPSNLKKGTYFGVAEQGFQKKTMTLIKL